MIWTGNTLSLLLTQGGFFFVKGYNIEVKNNLLEPKHIQNMGAAVWLYMWLLDKITSINENGVGKVLGNRAITHDEVYDEIGVDRRTYQRWVKRLRDYGYINTLRTPHGLVITINKATKSFKKRSDKSVTSPAKVKRQIGTSEATKVSHQNDKNVASIIKKTIAVDSNTNVLLQNTGDLPAAEFKELVSKLYYEAIKSLDLPINNHNTLRNKINEMAQTQDRQKIINYLTFMRDQFTTLEWNYKPSVTESLHIHGKRAQIRDTFERHVKGKKKGVTVI
jgi:hypothetical protein